MRMPALWFIVALLILLIPEFFRIYFIMPFPGSQESNTIGLAYFLHCYINVFRFIGVIIISFPLYYYWKKGNLRQKIFSGIFVLLYVFIFYVTNFIMQADKMFIQQKHQIFSTTTHNKVDENNIVIGVAMNGEAKAVPINVIGYHHQVLDSVGGIPVMFTYCTVCRSGRTFSPFVNGHYEKFRLVGMDHFNAMFEDATTGSWWRQENGEAITGKLKGSFLPEIPSQQMTLEQWIYEHPNTQILQPDSLFEADYATLKGFDYGLLKNDLEGTDHGSWKMKSWVIGVIANKKEKAYDWNNLKKRRVINDTIREVPVLLLVEKDTMSFHTFSRSVSNQNLFFEWNDSLQSLTDSRTHSIWNSKGECIDGALKGKKLMPLPSYLEYWHSWKQFHPGTTVYKN
ncbi:MAG TPA: DUF3179 domain-containing (seleno)protein [Chitinophagales bacterium]|nr:DUF3179 domain-containing (seleno)protein [Chitinophagales bacterium]